MPPNDWAGIGVVLLLVLPTLAVACVLITAPFSQWIGRRHDEEEQVIRAPLLVACIAIAAEAGVAIWLLVRGLPAQGIIVDVGRSALRADAFAAGTVLTVSAIAFIALIAAELARPDRPLGLWDIIPVLCMWTVHVALGLVATRGGVAMATVLVSLTAGI
ncbi:MAG TPA: hypothetical protein QGH10_19880, partial [Armatimonadota bacterium]|nr:hypothetical protein [Armatimonadota bacterium]